MKHFLLLIIALAISITANATECTQTIWTNPALAKCISYHWKWDATQQQDLLNRLNADKVEVNIFEVINARCDMHMTVYDPAIIEKQLYLDCTSNMLDS